PLPPVRTYVFQRALITAARGHRRPADPPYRYLRVRYGLLTPFAPGYLTASNPRAAGAPALKRWYLNARRWRLLHQPLASPSSRLLLSRRKPPHPSPSSPSSVLPSQPSQPSQPPLVLPHVHATRSAVDTTLALAPRLIVVGDVHGCIDELQALLRLADYAPGDQVIFLGDLVAKGPDSAAVVQLAREIGARTVRGNHDYELIRFCAARRRGLDPVVSPEHARIAATLSHQDYNFLCDAPWFIECAPWKHLFVHAGFIPRVKLTQQNPRLMMNMRSVLPDGTVTAKSVAGCEWARLWTGPQTVVFGHDACRGLQQYPFAKGIDTGCVYGGRLTALLLPENRSGTHLELSLITASIALTILIRLAKENLPGQFFSSFGLHASPERVALLYVLVLILVLSLSIASLTLGWIGRISLEALVAVGFALSPALADYSLQLSLGRRLFNLFLFAIRKGYKIHNVHDICYVRVESPCNAVIQRKAAKPPAKCRSKACDAQIYCVYLGRKAIYSFLEEFVTTQMHRLLPNCVREEQVRIPLHTRREGCYTRCDAILKARLVGHTRHTIDLCTRADEPRPLNIDFSATNILALSLVDEPHKVFLDTKCQVIAVVNLIFEICAIGELACFVRGHYLDSHIQQLVGSQGKQNWTQLKGRSTLVHKCVVQQLRLWDWMPDNFEHFSKDGDANKESLSQLFYILLDKSNILHTRPIQTGKSLVPKIVRDIKAFELN
ncbi:unnamed protein product, partial [Agarophyton chilense]